jgi:hypothetical protein
MAAYLVLKISGGSRGIIRNIRAITLEDFPQSPYPLRLFCTKSVNIHKPSPTTGRTNTDGGFPSRVYSLFGLYNPVYFAYTCPVHTTDHIHNNTVPAAHLVISIIQAFFNSIYLIVLLQFLAILLPGLASFTLALAVKHLFSMLVKHGLLLPGLKENSGNFYAGSFCIRNFMPTFFNCK